MERKYYLRGLGIGIAVTAIIMGIALSNDRAMTDEEIIARAKELGMVENTVLSGTSDESEESGNTEEDDAGESSEPPQSGAKADDDVSADRESVTAAGEAEPDAVDDKDVQAAADDDAVQTGSGNVPTDDLNVSDSAEPAGVGGAASETENEEENAQESTNEIITSATVKTIVVSSGDGSYTVARKLADVGVVISAETFDTFLCQNGYDKKLRPGTFSIPADASDEQIARIVTGAE